MTDAWENEGGNMVAPPKPDDISKSEIKKLQEDLEFARGVIKALLPYQERTVKAEESLEIVLEYFDKLRELSQEIIQVGSKQEKQLSMAKEALRLIDDRWIVGLDFDPNVARFALSAIESLDG